MPPTRADIEKAIRRLQEQFADPRFQAEIQKVFDKFEAEQSAEPRVYAVLRDCCTSGMCLACRGLQGRLRVVQAVGQRKTEAEIIADNWKAYNASVTNRVVHFGSYPEVPLCGLDTTNLPVVTVTGIWDQVTCKDCTRARHSR